MPCEVFHSNACQRQEQFHVLCLQDSCSKGLLSQGVYENLSKQVHQTTKRRVLTEMRLSVQGKVSVNISHTNIHKLLDNISCQTHSSKTEETHNNVCLTVKFSFLYYDPTYT